MLRHALAQRTPHALARTQRRFQSYDMDQVPGPGEDESAGIWSTGQSPDLVLHSAAFGIPKQRVERDPKTKQPGMLSVVADFLIGGSGPAPVNKERGPKFEVPESIAAMHGKGMQSTIRSEGRIVQTRLTSRQVGEDAYFLRQDALGIADGVGGWAARANASPALFSRLLMHFCHAELDRIDRDCHQAEELGDYNSAHQIWLNSDPVDVMQIAWERCVRASKREGIMGSSTALLAILRGKELRIANVGDCVLMLIRDGKLIFRSTEQQHSFNFPLQLGMMDATNESVSLAAALCQHRSGVIADGALDEEPPGLGEEVHHALHPNQPADATHGWDTPERDAGRWGLTVQEDDVILLATDGLLDNLFDEDIVEQVQHLVHRSRTDPEFTHSEVDLPTAISETLCRSAKAASEDSRLVTSPFQQQANEEGMYYVGGKNDDITVLTSVVARPPEPEDEDEAVTGGYASAAMYH